MTDIAEGLTTSRPNISQHLRVLRDAGLVRVDAVGTKRIYTVRPEALQALRQELDEFWTAALTNFKRRVEQKKEDDHE